MNQAETDQRDARRYRVMRELICAGEDRQRQVHAVIAPALGADGQLEPARIDGAMDLLLATMKLV